jgi:hypothetical protein
MLRAPTLSEKCARSMRPTVEAPFMMTRSQKVWSGLSFVSPGLAAEPVRSRVPKPRTDAH